jgi:hypothetical protein
MNPIKYQTDVNDIYERDCFLMNQKEPLPG